MKSTGEQIKTIIKTGIERDASDIHLFADSPPAYRVNDNLIRDDVPVLNLSDIESLVKSGGGLGLTFSEAKTLEEGGSLDTSFTISGIIRCRVHIERQLGGYSITIRLIPLEAKPFHELGLPVKTMENICRERDGLNLITGLKGKGKTTTLASIVDFINTNFSKHVVVIEDPVEFVHQNKKGLVTIREVGKYTSYTRALIDAQRKDADVVVVGEVRNREAMDTVLYLAEQGHLVFATLHSRSASGTIERIINWFEEEYHDYIRIRLANSLRSIISQELFPSVDKKRMVLAYEVLMNTMPVHQVLTGKGKDMAAILSGINNYIESGSEYGMVSMRQCIERLKMDKRI